MSEQTRRPRFIVADDKPTLSNLLRAQLEMIVPNAMVDVVSTGTELRTFCIKNRYDVVFADNDMEEYDAGIKCLKFLRANDITTPFYLVTGGNPDERILYELGGDLLTKPYSRLSLQTQVMKHVSHSELRHLEGER